MTPKPASDIRLELYVDGVFVRVLIITADEIAANVELPDSDGREPMRVYQDVMLPPGDRMAISLQRYHPGRTWVATYTADGRLVKVNSDDQRRTTGSYLPRPKLPLPHPEAPPDEPLVTG